VTDTGTQTPDPTNFYPCGCLTNSAGAHRGDGSASGPCPDYETVYPPDGSTRLEDLTWKRRDGR
jgi:hypothetical protein